MGRMKCVRTSNTSTIISGIPSGRSCLNIREIAQPERGLLLRTNLPEEIPLELPPLDSAMDLDTAEREVATEEVTEVHRSKAVSPEVDETLDLVVEIIAVEEAEVGVLGICHITGIWMPRKKMITDLLLFFLSLKKKQQNISIHSFMVLKKRKQNETFSSFFSFFSYFNFLFKNEKIRMYLRWQLNFNIHKSCFVKYKHPEQKKKKKKKKKSTLPSCLSVLLTFCPSAFS